jgi:hypothetical protein
MNSVQGLAAHFVPGKVCRFADTGVLYRTLQRNGG